MMFSFLQLLFSSSFRFCNSSSTSASDSGIVPQVFFIGFSFGWIYQIEQGHIDQLTSISTLSRVIVLGKGQLASLSPNSFFMASKKNLQNNLFCRLDKKLNTFSHSRKSNPHFFSASFIFFVNYFLSFLGEYALNHYHEKSNKVILSNFPSVTLNRLKSCPKPPLPVVH